MSVCMHEHMTQMSAEAKRRQIWTWRSKPNVCATKRALVSTKIANALNYRAFSLACPPYCTFFFLVLTVFLIIKKNDKGSNQLLGQRNEFTEVEIPCPT